MVIIADLSQNFLQVKTELIFRGSENIFHDKLHLPFLNKIASIIDLRTEIEKQEFDYNSQLPENIIYNNFPIEIEPAKDKYDGTPMESVYKYLGQDCKVSFSHLFKLISLSKKPLFIHCKHGIDRSGVVFTLLLLLTGASIDQIKTDYMVTNSNAEISHLQIFLNIIYANGGIEGYLANGFFSTDDYISLRKSLLK